MMPSGVPVATMAIGRTGASNAAVLAAQILARSDPDLARRLKEYKRQLADRIEELGRELKKSQNA
jgi:phosphoribosylcarboxyaminoimidazole (NCAIR) mutase